MCDFRLCVRKFDNQEENTVKSLAFNFKTVSVQFVCAGLLLKRGGATCNV